MFKQSEVTDNKHFEDNENSKRESIEELARFIKNHSFIKLNFHIAEIHVLAILRARKYVMSKAKELYERLCLFIYQNPKICVLNEELFIKGLEMYDSGAVVVMKERDLLGRRIVLGVTRKFDISKYTFEDNVRLFCIIFFTMLFEDETQKNGIIFINDHRGLGFNHISLFLFKLIQNISSLISVNLFRLKEIHVIGIPSIAVHLFKSIQYLFSDKNKKKLRVMNEAPELWNFVDQNLLTREYGGVNFSESEALAEFKKLIIEHKDEIIEFTNSIEIDVEKAKKLNKI